MLTAERRRIEGYTQLPDGEWILTDVLCEFKWSDPDTYDLLMSQGAGGVGF